MHFRVFTGAAVLLSVAPSALCVGTATVVNNCGFPIYYASVDQNHTPDMQQLPDGYSQRYSQEGVGISIKLSPNATTSGPVSQFEFTWADGKIDYDLSNINGYPWSFGGMSVVPSMINDPENPTCVPIDCPAHQSICTAAYNSPDETRTKVCDQESDLALTICPHSLPRKRSTQPGVRRHKHLRSNFLALRQASIGQHRRLI